MRGGEEVQISKRAGDLVALDDLVDEVGPDVARLTFLLQSLDTRQTVDLDLVTAQSKENPVFYVQYANARIHSIGRGSPRRGSSGCRSAEVDLSLLTHERELEMLRKLVRAARRRRPRVRATGPRTRSPPGCASWPTASTASTTTAT